MITLGLDIGSNSVGSAWIDTEQRTIHLGVSVFPAGVAESETKRGAPKNQKRREKRSQRRNINRRSKRRRVLRLLLQSKGLLPQNGAEWDHRATGKAENGVIVQSPWHLRRDGLDRPLTPHEFGRVLLHLNQRRGAVGIKLDDPGDKNGKEQEKEEKGQKEVEEGYVKEGMKRLQDRLTGRTFGQFIADEMDKRTEPVLDRDGNPKFKKDGQPARFCNAIRNRRDSHEFHAERSLIRDEFHRIWKKQRSFGDSPLAEILSDELKRELDNPEEDQTFRHRGAIFGQRRTYWNTGTLGRCDLEPSDRCCPKADRHAQEFLVLETVNNIRLEERGQSPRPLNEEEREKVFTALRRQKTASVATIRKALGIHKKDRKAFFALNLERDKDRSLNTDWFYREIVHGAIGEERWLAMTEQEKESINHAILKFDPNQEDHLNKLKDKAPRWWGLDEEQSNLLVAAWKSRPTLGNRVNLSRRAILNLLPYLRDGLSVTEARQAFAEDAVNDATFKQRERYALGSPGLSKAERHFLRKHPDLLPPAPMMSNPVVRKAIHEVRRHVTGYIRRFGSKPDRIVIEFLRGVKQTAKDRNKQLSRNRKREKERVAIEENLAAWRIPESNWKMATLRVRLCREQAGVCPYSIDGPNSDRIISEKQAAEGSDVEIEHIIPESLTGRTMNFNNVVLSFRDPNRRKGQRTPLDWLGRKDLDLALQRLEKTDVKKNKAKWDNLQAETPDPDQYRNSQLTDSAYAARQVYEYLASALYHGDTSGKRRIYMTKGEYTARLRADWGLYESEIDRAHGLEPSPDHEAVQNDPHLAQASRRARKDPTKDRVDHRHHALDALVVALTPDVLAKIGKEAADAREYKERTGYWPKRIPVEPPSPWTADEFREEAIEALNGCMVAHRPVKRKLVGAFHKEDLWGEVDEVAGVYRKRIRVPELKPTHLKEPVEENDQQVKNRLADELTGEGFPATMVRKIVRDRFAKGQFDRKTIDPALGKGGLVRDWELRRIIRDCLEANGVNPGKFTDKQIEEFCKKGLMRMPSGVPIKSVILVGPISDPVKIAVRDPMTGRQAVNSRTGKPVFRYHIGQNNHHIEIREDNKTSIWSGEVVPLFDAAKRVRTDKKPAVDRSEKDGKRFIISLAIGEMVMARRKDREHDDSTAVGVYVVSKIDRPARIHFAPHWDARKASDQDRWDVTPADLRNCGPKSDTPPYKVSVSPLGEVQPLERD